MKPTFTNNLDPANPPSVPVVDASAERGGEKSPAMPLPASSDGGSLGVPSLAMAETSLRVVRKRGGSPRRARKRRATHQAGGRQLTTLNLDTLLAQVAEHHHSALKLFSGAAHHAMQIGSLLLEAKASLGHGGLTIWIRDELCPRLGVSPRTISNYMRLARHKPRILRALQIERSGARSVTAEQLETEFARLDISTALRLVSPSRATKKAILPSSNPVRTPEIDTADEFLTPHPVVDGALALFEGAIDLDPCAERATEPNVPARTRFTRHEDGLSQTNRWTGRVFMHPPYGDVGDWVKRAVHEHAAGNTAETLLYLPVATEAAWNAGLALFPRVYLRERLRGVVANGSEPRVRLAPFPMSLIFLGPPARAGDFARTFQSFGTAYGVLTSG
jgi:hypothetical protein